MKDKLLKKAAVFSAVVAVCMAMMTGCGKKPDDAGMVHLDSADAVTSFMDEVYGGVSEDLLPGSLQTTELDMKDSDMMGYHTGLSNMEGIDGVYLSESMMGSVAYSAVYIRTADGADASAVRQQLMDGINPAKWICVTAEKQSAVVLGNDIFFVMGDPDTVDEVMAKAIEAAGAKGMKASETVEKINPI